MRAFSAILALALTGAVSVSAHNNKRDVNAIESAICQLVPFCTTTSTLTSTTTKTNTPPATITTVVSTITSTATATTTTSLCGFLFTCANSGDTPICCNNVGTATPTFTADGCYFAGVAGTTVGTCTTPGPTQAACCQGTPAGDGSCYAAIKPQS